MFRFVPNFFWQIFSQAVLVNGTLYVSGQLGIDPSSGELASGGVEAETRQALLNLGAILKAAGGDFGNGRALKKNFNFSFQHI